MDIELEHKISHEEPLLVEVERGQRGGYGWTIKYHGADPSEAILIIHETDTRLRAMFLVKGEKDEPVEGS